MKNRVFVFASCLLITAGAQAALHKWVDEKGQVHYGDEIPPQYLNQKRDELNSQGMVVKSHNAAKTQEQLDKEQQEKNSADQAKRDQAMEDRKKALRDRVLLETYTTEHDITLLRDDRIMAIDSQIQIAQSNLKEADKKQTDVNARIGSIEKSGRPVPENLRKEADTVAKQRQTYQEFINAQNADRAATLKKFDEDLQRFRELKAAQHKP